MTPDRLLAHFDHVAEAPDALPRLRQTILNLAVRGLLVPQDPNDESASELLKRSSLAARERRITDGKMKRPQPFSEHQNGGGASLQIPHSWQAVRLIDIAYLRSGIAVKHGDEMVDGELPFVKVADLSLPENSNGIVTSSRFIGGEYSDSMIERGSIVFPKRGGAIATNRKRVSLVEIVCDSNLMAMRSFLSEIMPYLRLWFTGVDVWRLNSGTSVPQINNKDIYPLRIPLPPLAEQHRIVAKVDELMALCDGLEVAQAEREKRRDRLAAASLHRLNHGAGTHAFREHARFHLQHLPRLTTRPEHIQQLRETILRSALLGRLTQGDADAARAADLVETLRNEHYRRWQSLQLAGFTERGGEPKSKRRKTPYKRPQDVNADGLPAIPTSWRWVRLELACPIVVDSPHRTPRYSPAGHYFALRPRDVSNGVLNLSGAARVDKEEFERQTVRHKPTAGDLVYSRELSYGWAVVVPRQIEVCLSQGMVSMRTHDEILTDFFVMLMNSPIVREQADNAALGAAHPHVNLQDIRGFALPLPPFAEQHRIVAKVDELMALCDRLEAQLVVSETESRRLLEAVLQEAVLEKNGRTARSVAMLQ